MKELVSLRGFWALLIYLAGLTMTARAQTPVVSVTNLVTTVSEPNALAEFLIVKDSGADVTVNFEMLGSAVLGTDYVIVGGATSVVVRGTVNVATVHIQVLDDFSIEPDKTITLHVLPGAGYTVGTASATITLRSDDSAASLQWLFDLHPTISRWLDPMIVAPNSALTFDTY